MIYAEEVGHVAYGSKWFNWLCGRDGLDPKEVFHTLVRRYFHGTLKPPFNEEKRAEAGLPPDFYWPLTERPHLTMGRMRSQNTQISALDKYSAISCRYGTDLGCIPAFSGQKCCDSGHAAL